MQDLDLTEWEKQCLVGASRLGDIRDDYDLPPFRVDTTRQRRVSARRDDGQSFQVTIYQNSALRLTLSGYERDEGKIEVRLPTGGHLGVSKRGWVDADDRIYYIDDPACRDCIPGSQDS